VILPETNLKKLRQGMHFLRDIDLFEGYLPLFSFAKGNKGQVLFILFSASKRVTKGGSFSSFSALKRVAKGGSFSPLREGTSLSGHGNILK
jgi:hypothetical protein